MYPQKRNKHENLKKLFFFVECLEGYWHKEQDPEPDLLVRGSGSVTKCHGSGTLEN